MLIVTSYSSYSKQMFKGLFMQREILIPLPHVTLKGHLAFFDHPRAWVVFVHGSGSSHLSPRNKMVAEKLYNEGYSTLLFDLLTEEEDRIYTNRFNIPLLAQRLSEVIGWLQGYSAYHQEPIVYFGASTGAAAALVAAAAPYRKVPLVAVVSRGGRPDLAKEENLRQVNIPVLLLVGSLDHQVISLNQQAQQSLKRSELVLIEGATHLFEEPGTLDKVITKTCEWLEHFLPKETYVEGLL